MNRALIIEDQDLMRLALIAEVRAGLRDCHITGASTLEAAVSLLEREAFDLVIVDPGLPGVDPTSRRERIRAIRTVLEHSPDAVHVVVTGSDDKDEAEACRGLGVQVYLGKTGLSPGDLARLIEVGSCEKFSVQLSKTTSKPPERRFPTLVPRQDQIITMMMERMPGMKRREVFAEMAKKEGISKESVEKYYKQARAKLQKIGQLPKDL